MAARVNNYHVVITTAIATFAMSRPIQDSPDMVKWVAKQISETNNADVSIYLNGECKAQHKVFADGHVPAVWTHTPLPVGMAAAALQTKFEERAAVVLGDYDSKPSFDKCAPDGPWIYTDNRYQSEAIRMAWMMYVDQAIEHFVATK